MKKWLFLLLLSLNLHAEPIEFVVTASAGGPEDVLIRKLSNVLENKTNLKFVVLNKPGAAKSIGYSYVEKTNRPVLLTSSDSILDHSVIKSVEPLFYIGSSSVIWFTSSKSEIKTFDDLIKLSGQREIKVAHAGPTTQGYKASVSFCDKIFNCLLVPFKSGPESMIGLLSDTVDVVPLVSYGNLNYIENEKYHSIFVMSNTKNKAFDVPLLPSKYKNLEKMDWTILFGKNLSEADKKTIVDTLKNLDSSFYTDMGFHYSFKDTKKLLP